MPFSPQQAGTIAMAVSNVGSASIDLPPGFPQIRIFNAGSNLAFIEVGKDSALAAVVPLAGGVKGGMPLAPGAGSLPILLDKGDANKLAAISTVGATTIYITPGTGDGAG